MTDTILVVDDERAISETIEYALRVEGFLTQSCTTGKDALALVATDCPSLIILDVGLPDRTGFEICKDIRVISQVPIIFLTARSEEIDRVLGLEIGGDDYVVKPFSPRELVARVKVILKRAAPRCSEKVRSPQTPFVLDVQRCRISFYSTALDLSKYELRILSLFIKWPGRVFAREEIMNKVWESPEMSLERTVDSHIKSLRAKLEAVRPGTEAIVTHRGLGYALKEEW
jgi:two-component system catabolic regulation response regulator CreB